jgi:N6-L-threonylcarbamoyladenine synthase
MRVLAIESSCDETAAAIVESGGRVLADIVSSQIERHIPFGGVVPEVASREHLERITAVVEQALAAAQLSLADIDAIAVTTGPGLIGALFVGTMFAKGLAYGRGLPLVAVNHLQGHLAASRLLTPPPPRPHVALLVSGGHTALYRVDASIRTLGTTLDDAAGEAFDKTAKMLGIPYPGGAALSRAAEGGRRDAVALPIGMPQKANLDFSFSGLKTAVRVHLQKRTAPLGEDERRDLCASIEAVIVEALVSKAVRACEREGLRDLVLAGGVAANGHLRERAAQAMALIGGRAHAPPKPWCTDNAAMIGAAALDAIAAGETASLSVAPRAYWPL